jgi:hypothetical protein
MLHAVDLFGGADVIKKRNPFEESLNTDYIDVDFFIFSNIRISDSLFKNRTTLKK